MNLKIIIINMNNNVTATNAITQDLIVLFSVGSHGKKINRSVKKGTPVSWDLILKEKKQ